MAGGDGQAKGSQRLIAELALLVRLGESQGDYLLGDAVEAQTVAGPEGLDLRKSCGGLLALTRFQLRS